MDGIKFDKTKEQLHTAMGLDMEKIELQSKALEKVRHTDDSTYFDETKKAIELASSLEELVYLVHTVAFNQGVAKVCEECPAKDVLGEIKEQIEKELKDRGINPEKE